MRTRAKMKVVASDRERRPNVLRHILLIYANNEPKSALARDLGDCRDNKGKLAKRVFTCRIGLNVAYMENDRIKKV